MLCYPQVTLSSNPLQSLLTIEAIIDSNIPIVALTNKNLLGAYSFWKAMKERNRHAVLGMSVSVQLSDAVAFLFLYARNQNGWKNLLKLSSAIETNELQSVPFNWFVSYSKDCFVVAPLQDFINYDELLNTFTNEQLHYGINRTNGMRHEYEEDFIEMANASNIKIIVVQEMKYKERNDSFAYDVLQAIGSGEKIPDIKRTEPLHFIPTTDEMKSWYPKEWLKNTETLLKSCHVDLSVGDSHLPKFPAENANRLLHDLCHRGLNARIPNASINYVERLAEELNVIQQMGYEDYFLIVHDFMLYAKEEGILTGPGRGSSASSLVAFCLFITDVDPLKYKLLFERFLNKERITLPD